MHRCTFVPADEYLFGFLLLTSTLYFQLGSGSGLDVIKYPTCSNTCPLGTRQIGTTFIMKIATWNLERPTRNGQKSAAILEYLKKVNADILVLTETNEFINLGSEYELCHTEIFSGSFYKQGDRQVSIFSKYPIVRHIPTFRSDTSLCLTVDTPYGELIIYGTIIGNFGNGGDQFKLDLEKQLADFEAIGKAQNFCIIGDLNISFSDNTYFTKEGREKLRNSFEQLGMKIMTQQITQNIDHIILAKEFIANKKIVNGFWNDTGNKLTRMSDHKGVFLELFE
ncbi:MAG: endonuclease/exonuclease/phosphatase family protein [Chitinophagaceae bacterium]|nr:endonuclease/exonuclease/phosphatase family protein [Chitinophagaceae bacterium]